MGDQRPDDADMGKSARRAAAECQPDHRPPDAAQPHPVTAIGAVLATPDPTIQHRTSPKENFSLQDKPIR
jgi:hypothetical protein